MKLNWNNLHLQSREEICRGARVSMNLASKSWKELEPWLQELLAFSLEQRTFGRVASSDVACVHSATGVAKVTVADTMKSVYDRRSSTFRSWAEARSFQPRQAT